MKLHEEFEWDMGKSRRNFVKHGVSFDDAAVVLADPDGDRRHYEELDELHSEREDRFVTIAPHPANLAELLTIVWTERAVEQMTITRIISARRATEHERADYVRYFAKRLGPHQG